MKILFWLIIVAGVLAGVMGYLIKSAELDGARGSYTPRDPLIEMNGG